MEPVLLLLPDDFLRRLLTQAERRGLDPSVLVNELLVAELPDVLADVLAEPIDAEAVDELSEHANGPEAPSLQAAHTIAVPQRVDYGQRT